MAAGAQRQQTQLSFPFPLSDFGFSLPNPSERGRCRFFLCLSQPGSCRLTSPTLKGLEQGDRLLTLPTYLPVAKAVDKSHKEALPKEKGGV